MSIVSTRLYFFVLVGFLMLNGFSCDDDNQGCSADAPSSESRARVWETSDGGATWDTYFISLQIERLSGITFIGPDALNAISLDGRILRTTDGGSTWVSIPFGYGPLNQIIALKAYGHGIIVGNRGMVLRTSDGGQNWTQISFPDNTVDLRSIAFAEDDLHGLAVGQGATGGDGGIFGTTNGGVTWQRLSNESATDVVALSETEWLFSNPGNRVRRSTDGGRTLVDVPDSISAMFADPTSVRYLESAGGLTILAIDNDGRIYKSTDGGLSWVVKASGLTSPGDITNFGCSSGVCAAVGRNSRAVISNDGGDTWNVASGISTTETMRGAHFIDSQFGYIVGD